MFRNKMAEEKSTPVTKKSQKKVEHCIFEWSIENFSLCKREPTSFIYSPYFKLHPCSSTCWYFYLSPARIASKGEGITLFLKRDPKDEGPPEVHLHLKFQVSFSNEIFFNGREYYCFTRGRDYAFNSFSSVERLLGKLVEDDTLHVTCDLYIFNDGLVEPSKSDPDYDFYCLSSDVRKFQTREDFNDVTLSMKDGTIMANKVVLSARSPIFKDMLKSTTQSPVIDLPNVEMAVMREILGFIYSGDLEALSTKESSPYGLYECVESLKIDELTSILQPNIIIADSLIEADHCEFTWRIEDFNLSDTDSCNTCVESLPFGSCCGNTKWILKLFHRSRESPKHVSIFVDCCSKTSNNYISLEISLLDEDGKAQYTSQLVKAVPSYGRCGFSKFMERKSLEQSNFRSFNNNSITIQCTLKLSSEEIFCKVEKNLISSLGWGSNWYSSVSKDFGKLYESGNLSDLLIVVSDKDFKVHKFVLCARSKTFAEQIKDRLSPVLKLGDTDIEAFDIFLKYVYSGVIDTTNLEVNLEMLLQLFEISKKFHVKPLRDKCSDIVQSKFKVETVCEILTRDCMENSKVRKAAMEYICSHAHQVMITEQWQNVIQTRRELAEEVLRLLAESFQNSGK